MNFIFAARLLDEGQVLTRKSWEKDGYIFKDEHGRLQFFDYNEPVVYQPSVEDTLASDWTVKAKGCWTIVSVTHDFELMENKLFVTYHICLKENGRLLNHHQITPFELSTWSRCVELDMNQSAQYLNPQDLAHIQQVISA